MHGYSKRAHNDAKTGTTEGNGVLLTAHMSKGMPYSEKITSIIHWENWRKFRIDALMSSILESQRIVCFFRI